MSDDAALRSAGATYDDVAFELRVSEVPHLEGLVVLAVQLREHLSALPTAVITARHTGGRVEPRELLGKDCELSIERPRGGRHFKGIIASAHVDGDLVGTHVLKLNVVPALWLLTQQRDSRIYQDEKIADVVADVVERRIGGRGRSVRADLSKEYEKHEYVVQYQESDYAFIARLLEREGIFFYLDHEEEHEVLVLADAIRNLSHAREGKVPFAHDPHALPDHEGISSISHDEILGATGAAIAGFDWTHPDLTVRGEETGDAEESSELEVYRHIEAVTYHRYEGTQYGANSAGREAKLEVERLELERRRWHLTTTVVSAQPGRLIEVEGSPGLDETYLIVGNAAHGVAGGEGRAGSWRSSCEAVPTQLPYRAARRTPWPVAHGVETATVVGPSGQEIHTDEHGRVKVQFHWDRRGQRDERSSCWIRVMQSWAGPGYGTFFLPRIGMEVVISFLGGDPDRPVVIGCMYNGANPSPAHPLPDHKTQSVIRTRSSQNSSGFNELRFEDEASEEEIYFHAERDLRYDVKHDRQVFVGNDERIRVKNDRRREVDGNEHTEVRGRRREIQRGAERASYLGNRSTLHARKTRFYEHIRGDHDIEYDGGGLVVRQLEEALQAHLLEGTQGFSILNGPSHDVLFAVDPVRHLIGAQATNKVELRTKDRSAKFVITPGNIAVKCVTHTVEADSQVELKVGEDLEIVMSTGTIQLRAGGSQIILGPEGITLVGDVTVMGSGFNVLAGRVSRGGNVTWDP